MDSLARMKELSAYYKDDMKKRYPWALPRAQSIMRLFGRFTYDTVQQKQRQSVWSF